MVLHIGTLHILGVTQYVENGFLTDEKSGECIRVEWDFFVGDANVLELSNGGCTRL